MIRHVVVVKLKDKAQAVELKTRMETLPPQIPEIKSYEIGINEVESERALDISLVSTFDSYDGLKAYNVHPAHQEVVSFIREIAASVHSIDYTLAGDS